MQGRTRPAERDRLLALFEVLASSAVLLKGRLILQGRVVVVADELFAGAGSEDRLPGTVFEMLQALYQLTQPPRTYGEPCSFS